MRITIKALLKRKFNDRVKKQAEAAKILQVKAAKQASMTPAVSVEMETQVTPVEDEKVSLTIETQPLTISSVG